GEDGPKPFLAAREFRYGEREANDADDPAVRTHAGLDPGRDRSALVHRFIGGRFSGQRGTMRRHGGSRLGRVPERFLYSLAVLADHGAAAANGGNAEVEVSGPEGDWQLVDQPRELAQPEVARQPEGCQWARAHAATVAPGASG